MRVHGEVSYALQHGEGLAGVVSVWSVPYSAAMCRGTVEEVEADGMPTLTGLSLHVGNLQRPLELPDAVENLQWQLAWSKAHRYCEAELLERFAADCQERYWSQCESAAA